MALKTAHQLVRDSRQDHYEPLGKGLFTWIGNRPMAQIHAMELLATLQKIEDRQAIETAHRVLDIANQDFRSII
jgi:hypothetical protein